MAARHARVTIDVDVVPQFTACYLRLAGDECAFIEAHTAHALPKLLGALAAAGRRPEDVRWIVVTHAHLDHAAGAGALMAACPRATLVAHPRTVKHLVSPGKLIASAQAVYGQERFARLYGAVTPVAADRVLPLEDGSSIEVGGARLTAWHTAGHAYHHAVIADPALDCVYTGDTFGLVYPPLQRHGPLAIPSTSPTGFDAPAARRSLYKVLALGAATVCPTHFDGHPQPAALAAQLRRLLDEAEAWVEDAARGADDAAALLARFDAAWRSALQETAPWLTAADWALLQLDIELNAQGLVHAALARRSSPAA